MSLEKGSVLKFCFITNNVWWILFSTYNSIFCCCKLKIRSLFNQLSAKTEILFASQSERTYDRSSAVRDRCSIFSAIIFRMFSVSASVSELNKCLTRLFLALQSKLWIWILTQLWHSRGWIVLNSSHLIWYRHRWSFRHHHRHWRRH